MIKKIITKLKSKNFSICVIGLGYVGLPLLSRFLKEKINVFGIDIDRNKIKSLRNGKIYIKSTDPLVAEYFKKNNKNVSTDYKIANNCDVLIICLPTPLKKNSKKPDMSYIFNCARILKKYIKKNQIIVLESTVYPGATREFAKILVSKKFVIGENIFIGYSPERENPGDKNFSYKKTPKVISGYTDNCLLLIKIIYNFFVKKLVIVEKIEEAELSKILENLYRAVNIGLVNELKIICNKLNIDITNTINAAATKNFGFQKFVPGPGLGGHCIPIDPFYLSWVSKKNGYDPKFIKLSGIINSKIPNWTIKQVLKKIKKDKKIKMLLLGLSYKKNVDDDRESPSYEFIKILNKKKIKYDYHDPYFTRIRTGRKINENKKSIKLNKNNLKKYDATILLTDHDIFDYKLIAKHSKLIIDTRGRFKKIKLNNYKNINFF
jgi:UDP-N-acetyl-D-glucosamine dehydrogenase